MGPIPFISVKNNKFVLEKQGVAFFRSLQARELVIVCLAGRYRTGKSFLLNQLLGVQSGFQTSASTDPCTEGLWIWGQEVGHGDDDQKTFVFIDSEGCGSTARGQDYDSKLFAIAVMLSSFFMYNTLGTIDENAIQSLATVAELASMISKKDKVDTGFFPELLWVVRDFSLRLDGDADDYLAQQLASLPIDASASSSAKELAASRNDARQKLKNVFPHRACQTIVRPANDESVLNDLSRNTSKLRPEFRKNVEEVRRRVLVSGRTKQIGGRALNGAYFVDLAASIVEQVNSGALPDIRSSWDSILADYIRVAHDEAQDAYVKVLDEHVARHSQTTKGSKAPLSAAAFQSAHEYARDHALTLFTQAVGDRETQESKRLHARLVKYMSDYFEPRFATVQSEYAEYLATLLQADRLVDHARRSDVEVEGLVAHLLRIMDAFRDGAAHALKTSPEARVLNDFIRGCLANVIQDVCTSVAYALNKEKKKAVAAAHATGEESLNKLRGELKQVRAALTAAERSVQERDASDVRAQGRVNELERMLHVATTAKQDLAARVQSLEGECHKIDVSYSALLQNCSEKDKEIASLKSQLATAAKETVTKTKTSGRGVKRARTEAMVVEDDDESSSLPAYDDAEMGDAFDESEEATPPSRAKRGRTTRAARPAKTTTAATSRKKKSAVIPDEDKPAPRSGKRKYNVDDPPSLMVMKNHLKEAGVKLKSAGAANVRKQWRALAESAQ